MRCGVCTGRQLWVCIQMRCVGAGVRSWQSAGAVANPVFALLSTPPLSVESITNLIVCTHSHMVRLHMYKQYRASTIRHAAHDRWAMSPHGRQMLRGRTPLSRGRWHLFKCALHLCDSILRQWHAIMINIAAFTQRLENEARNLEI